MESTDSGTAALVTQMQAELATSQERVAATATKLAADPRTTGPAAVLATVAATASPSTVSPATKIADQAAAVTARLATVADDRAKLAEPKRGETGRASLTPRDPSIAGAAAGVATVRPGASARPANAAIAASPNVRPTATEPTRTSTPSVTAVRTPPTNLSAARQAAEKAKEAASKALQAAEKAKRGATRTASPTFTRR